MSDTKSSPAFFPRALALIILGVMVHLWCTHHLGKSLAGIGWVSGLAAAFSAALAFLDKLAEDEQKKRVTKGLQGLARILLAKPVLVILYLVAVLLGLSYASVTVVPDAEGDRLSARLQAVGGAKVREQKSEKGVLRFLVPTNPFGRSYRIKVAGYINQPIEVYPLLGIKILSERDLRPSPSVLLRPHIGALRDLEDKAELVVQLLQEDREPLEIVRVGRGDGTGSFILGRSQRITATILRDWTLELRALGLDGNEGEHIPKHIWGWKHPRVARPRVELEPGMRLRAKIITKAGKCSACAEFTLSRASLADIYMNLCTFCEDLPIEEHEE